MAKLNYERLSKEKHTTLEEANTGDVIKWGDALYIVTDSYSYADERFRGIMHILSYCFGELVYIDTGVNVDILENAEITIKY